MDTTEMSNYIDQFITAVQKWRASKKETDFDWNSFGDPLHVSDLIGLDSFPTLVANLYSDKNVHPNIDFVSKAIIGYEEITIIDMVKELIKIGKQTTAWAKDMKPEENAVEFMLYELFSRSFANRYADELPRFC